MDTIINKIMIQGGEILMYQSLRISRFDSESLQRARQSLKELQSGSDSVVVPILNGPEVKLTLGLEPDPDSQAYLLRQWGELYPDAPLSEYEAHRQAVNDHLRRCNFYIRYSQWKLSYDLILEDCPDDDAALYGGIAGSWLRAHGSKTRDDGPPTDLDFQRHYASVKEIVALKPAFIAPVAYDDCVTRFADHFAVTMLFSEDRLKAHMAAPSTRNVAVASLHSGTQMEPQMALTFTT